MRPEEIAHPAEALQDASWFGDLDEIDRFILEDPFAITPRRRPWWVPEPSTIAVIIGAAFVFALMAVIAANRFVF